MQTGSNLVGCKHIRAAPPITARRGRLLATDVGATAFFRAEGGRAEAEGGRKILLRSWAYGVDLRG